ncbi:MAG: hypothetical protein V5A27_00235 [Halapricum sp.]
MGRGNRDRYGYRHREDPDYEVGESKPGTVGDSQGTYHDRARQDNNVIVDGEVRSVESHRRSSVEAEKKTKASSRGKSSSSSGESISQAEAAGKVVTLTIDKEGGTEDTLAEYKNHQVHVEGGTPGDRLKVRLEQAQGYLVGRRIKVNE